MHFNIELSKIGEDLLESMQKYINLGEESSDD